MIVVHAKPKIEAWEWQPGMTIPERVVDRTYWRIDVERRAYPQPLFRQVTIPPDDSDSLCYYCHQKLSLHAYLPNNLTVCPGDFIVREGNRTFGMPAEEFRVEYEEQ